MKDRGGDAHLNRHAGAYVGTVLAPVLGTGIGALFDIARRKSNIIKTAEETAVSDKTAAAMGLRGPVLMGASFKPALRELSDRSEGLVEFARGDFLRQAVGKYSDVAPAVVPGVSPSVVGPRGKEWRSQFLLWARKRAAKQMV